MQNPDNLAIARLAEQMVLDVYRFVRTLPPSERYNLASQLVRSSTSVKDNIHEGCGREGNRAMLPSLHHANASAREMTGQLKQARMAFAGDQLLARNLHRRAERLRYLITKFIKAVQRRLESEGF